MLQKIFEAAIQLGFHKTRNIKKLKYHRTWVNKMHKGCDAVAHRHTANGWTITHIVAIYYTDVPKESADLVFINDDSQIMRGNSVESYLDKDKYTVKSQTGRLICHDARFFHGTTVHQNEETRTCIIIEVGFPPL